MKVYAIAEACYVASRYDTGDEYNDAKEPVILIHHGLFKDQNKAEEIAAKINKTHEDKNQTEGFMDDAFYVIEMEIK